MSVVSARKPRTVFAGGLDTQCRASHIAFERDIRSARIGAGGLSTGGTGIGVGGSCIGLGSCGSGRTGGLPGGLGFPGCPPMSKLRSGLTLEKTPPHLLSSAHRRLRHCRGGGPVSVTLKHSYTETCEGCGWLPQDIGMLDRRRPTRSGRPGGGNTEVRLTHRWGKV